MNYSILVNTCDNFEDCWDPFFLLLSIYWPDYSDTVFLNTEYKDYSYKEARFNVVPLKVCGSHGVPQTKRSTWSQCLRWALESIDTDIVLYMQEDYFLKEFVDHSTIQKYADYLQENDDVKCIYLHCNAVEKENEVLFDGLKRVSRNGWRLSCQSALWRKQELLDILRDCESPWEFENFGNKRSVVLAHEYLTVDKTCEGKDIILIPYVFTGIIKGKWLKDVVPLFRKFDINVDYNKRGFYTDTKRTIANMVKYRISLIPKLTLLFFDLCRINKTKNIKDLLIVLIRRQNRIRN